jgi:hypothetical protein
MSRKRRETFAVGRAVGYRAHAGCPSFAFFANSGRTHQPFGPLYNHPMQQPIKVDNSQPATAYDTARTLGVSKRRTEQIIREVRRTLFRDANTGEFVVRAKRSGKKAVSRSHNGSTKVRKTTSARRKG